MDFDVGKLGTFRSVEMDKQPRRKDINFYIDQVLTRGNPPVWQQPRVGTSNTLASTVPGSRQNATYGMNIGRASTAKGEVHIKVIIYVLLL